MAMSPEDEDKTIRDVNAKYNQLIAYKTQTGNGGKGTGGWQLEDMPDGGEGDCDNFARTKGEALIKAGVDPSKLSIVVAKLWNGVDHAVLQVDRGDGKYMYLSNPMNNDQKNNPDLSISDEPPGEPKMRLSQVMWAPMHDAFKEAREKEQN